MEFLQSDYGNPGYPLSRGSPRVFSVNEHVVASIDDRTRRVSKGRREFSKNSYTKLGEEKFDQR